FTLKYLINGRRHSLACKSDGEGNWTKDSMAMPEYQGCIDIDIPLTPFTNTLPIRRLKLADGQSATIRVLYLDVLAERFMPVSQKYKRLSATAYHYENVPNDFEATITVDSDGLVEDYPALFVRTMKKEIKS